MILNIFLLGLFATSAALFWYRISIKLPELIAISDSVITKRLHEDSARFHLFLLHFRSYFGEGHYKRFLLRICGKFLYRIHIFVLKIDNALVDWLRKIR